MNDKIYTKEHEWIEVIENNMAIIGITDFAQKQLGDIVFVELPEKGKSFNKGDEIAVVESVKAASEVYSGVSGQVLEVNDAIVDEPQLVNSDPETKGWFVKIKIDKIEEFDELMSLNEYKEFCLGLE